MASPFTVRTARAHLDTWDGTTIGWLIVNGTGAATASPAMHYVSEVTADELAGAGYARGDMDVVFDIVGDDGFLLRDPGFTIPTTDTSAGDDPAGVWFYDKTGGSDATRELIAFLPVAEGPGFADWDVDPSDGIAKVSAGEITSFTPIAPLALGGDAGDELALLIDTDTLAVEGGALTVVGGGGRAGSIAVAEDASVIDIATAYDAGTEATFVAGLTSLTGDPEVDIQLPDPATSGALYLIVSSGTNDPLSDYADFAFSSAAAAFVNVAGLPDLSAPGVGYLFFPISAGAEVGWGGTPISPHLLAATSVSVDASGFTGNLSGTDTDVQAALATIDALDVSGGAGDVVGPASSVDGRAVLFDGTTGKLIKQASAAPVLEGDSRLTDARTPTSHNHAASEVTSGTLDIARIPTGTTGTTVPFGNDARFSDARTPTAHTHAAADVTSGTLDIARIPTGTTGTTVPFGNDSRFTDSRTPTGSAGGDLTGTYPNPTIGSGKVTSTMIADGTIVDGDISSSAAIDRTKLATPRTGLYVSGSLYQYQSATGGSRSVAPGNIVFFPVLLDGPATIDALSIDVLTGAASGTAHLYLVTASATTGRPTASSTILASTSSVIATDTSTSRVTGVFGSSYSASAGLYWGALHAIVGTATYRAVAAAFQLGPPLAAATGTSANGLSCISASGGGTSTTPLANLTGVTMVAEVNQAPIIAWRAA